MKTLMTATALAALVAASPALAQSTETPASPPAMTEPAPAPSMQAPDAPAMTVPESTLPDMGSPDGATAPSMSSPDTAAASSDLFITQQAADHHLASSLIGASVKNGADEDLGSINDIVLSDAGNIDAVVIGVGGFLGIGEKNVGVSFDAIGKSTDADGNVVLVLETTREQLEAAPAFVTVAEARQDQEMSAPAATTEPVAPAPAQ